MNKPIKIVLTDDDGNPTGSPEPNDRMLMVTIKDPRRKRVVAGTCTMVRWTNIVNRVRQRWPKACMSKAKFPVIGIRKFRGGPLIVIAMPLPGPVASVATKH